MAKNKKKNNFPIRFKIINERKLRIGDRVKIDGLSDDGRFVLLSIIKPK